MNKTSKKRLILFSIFLILIVISYGQIFSGKIISVIDGDTIEILHQNKTIKVRLAEIDCPEIDQPFGLNAKDFTSKLCLEKTVKVIDKGNDKYGRTLAEIVLPDGKSLNKELLKVGLAWWYKKYSKDLILRDIENKAKKDKVGLWADRNCIPPWEYRASSFQVEKEEIKISPKQVEKEIIVYITRTGKKYHRGYCSYLRKSKIPISLKQAKRLGYTPCSRCNPPR